MNENGGAPGRDETDKERLDRNFTELLGGLRVVLPGVQVLFAFLLAVPFNQRFAQTTTFEKDVYLVTLVLTTLAAALLMAPTSQHRIEFRRDDKRHVVFMAHRLSIAGFGVLALAMSGVVLLVSSFLYSDTTAVIVTLFAATAMFGLWFAVPVARLRTLRQRLTVGGDAAVMADPSREPQTSEPQPRG